MHIPYIFLDERVAPAYRDDGTKMIAPPNILFDRDIAPGVSRPSVRA